MAFWGVEVKPGKPFTHFFDRIRGRLHVSQATLGNGSASKKCVVQCNVGNKSPVLLCALLPDKNESCALALEFEEAEDVIFSVVGPRSVFLTGYYLGGLQNSKFDDDTESYGEDIANMEESDRSNDEDEYDDSFIDDNDPEVMPPSPVSDCGEMYKNGEEVKDEKPEKEKSKKRLKKKHHISDSDDDDDNAPKAKVVNHRVWAIISDSSDDGDDDRLPFSFLHKTENSENGKNAEPGREGEKKMGTETGKGGSCVAETSPEVNSYLMNGDTQRQSKKDPKLKKKRKECSREKNIGSQAIKGDKEDWRSGHGSRDDLHPTEVNNEGPKPKKRKKEQSRRAEILEADRGFQSEILIKDKERSDTFKKKNGMKFESGERSEDCTNQIASRKQLEEKRDKKKKSKGEENDQETNTKLPNSAVRILSNGMEIEELDMGKPESKVATKGKKVKITFAGRLVGGNVFDSNKNSAPYKFRLGSGKVIEGWDIGIEGMRVGGRRILKIPPSLGQLTSFLLLMLPFFLCLHIPYSEGLIMFYNVVFFNAVLVAKAIGRTYLQIHG